MQEIRSFYGIVISMYFSEPEHNPPHFHATYGEYTAAFDINTLRILEGSLPAKAHALIMEWAVMHQDELMAIWNTQKFNKIKPLE